MSSYIKPQSPLYNEAVDTYIYPLTTVDQIVLSNGERLNESYFGKGIELNYSIVGGLEEPENPTENMIWVETDVNITDHIISKNEPKNPEEGMVWIYNNNESNANFYKLKYGDIGVDEVYPISAKQYISGAWVDKIAKSYQNGEWVDWIVYLFNNGDQCENITGGWEKVYDSGQYGGTLTFSNGLIKLVGDNQNYGARAGCSSLDIGIWKNFSTLYLETADGTTGGVFRIVNDYTNQTVIVQQEITSGVKTYALSLSGVTSGKVVIGAYMGTLSVKKIWLE